MKTQLLSALFVLSCALPGEVIAQVDLARATYIGVEQWRDTVNSLPGVDRQIVSQDIGKLNLSVGIIHRRALTPGASGGRGRGGGAAASDCGVASGADSGARGIQPLHQTETYIIVSGDHRPSQTLALIKASYGHLKAREILYSILLSGGKGIHLAR